VNAIDETMLFPQHLEQSGTGVFAQNRIQQPQGKPPVVVARTDSETKRELQLGGWFSGATHHRPYLIGICLKEVRSFSRQKRGSNPLHGSHRPRMVHVSGNGNNQSRGYKILLTKAEQFLPLEAVERSFRSRERPAEGMVWPHRLIEQFVNE